MTAFMMLCLKYSFTLTLFCRFRVLSYNILADLYAETDVALAELFSYCPRHALKIDYRKQLFVKEILG